MTALRKKRTWYLRPLPILAILAGLLFTPWFVFGRTGVWDSGRLQAKKRAQTEKIRLLEAKKQRLESCLAALKKGDEQALERAAREQDFVGPGETIYEIRVEPSKP
ncbi:MAG: septum formation initiator family protein [bacterium]|nr:septum formation initiator family protein [bacterium]